MGIILKNINKKYILLANSCTQIRNCENGLKAINSKYLHGIIINIVFYYNS